MHIPTQQEVQWLLEEKHGGIKTDAFASDLEKLASGVPIAYLIGHVPFCGCTIDLSLRPLIPRVETEFWVSHYLFPAIANSCKNKERITLLDICAGSGCIGIASLHRFPLLDVDFADINPRFIKQIMINGEKNMIARERMRGYQSNMFNQIPPKRYDIIVANPPYIAREKMHEVDQSVLDHEDHSSLFADQNGLLYIEQLIVKGKEFLNAGGTLYMEHGSDQKDAIAQLFKKHSVKTFRFLKDQYNHDRVVQCTIDPRP